MGAVRRRGRHRKARVAEQQHVTEHDRGRKLRDERRPERSRRGGTAFRSVAPSITAVAVLVGAGVMAVDPVASPPPEIAATSAEVLLAADSSVLFIPINLVQDIINIPYNEVQAIDLLGDNLLFNGTWYVSSSTSIWGTDPADIGRYYGLANLFIPFPAFSNALADQIAGLSEVLLPINSAYGIDYIDSSKLYDGWFRQDRIMALLTTGQWTFDTTPVTDANGTHPPEGVWNYAGPITFAGRYNHPEWNTKTDPATGQPLVPWAGTTFVLDPLSPFTNYFAHLMSDPTSEENSIKLPTLDETAAAVQKFGYGLYIDFWPWFPGYDAACFDNCPPLSDLGEPWYHDTRYKIPSPGPTPTTDSPALNSAPVDADASSNPPSTGGAAPNGASDEKGAGRKKVGKHSTIGQTANAADTGDTAGSTDALDGKKKTPSVAKDAKKAEPPRPSGDAGRQGGSDGAVNAGPDQPRTSHPSKKPSGAASDG